MRLVKVTSVVFSGDDYEKPESKLDIYINPEHIAVVSRFGDNFTEIIMSPDHVQGLYVKGNVKDVVSLIESASDFVDLEGLEK